MERQRPSRRSFIYGLAAWTGFIAPVCYVASIAATASHEILGHGLVAWLVDGQFVGFDLHPDGMGHAWAWSDRHQHLVLAGGVLASIAGGLVCLTVGCWKRLPFLARMAALLFATYMLQEGLPYGFWNCCYVRPPGDFGRIFLDLDNPVLRYGLIALFGSGYLASVIVTNVLMFRCIEDDLGPFTAARAAAVASILGIGGVISYFSFDWNQLIENIGRLPQIVGAGLCVTVAVLLVLIRRPAVSAAPVGRHGWYAAIPTSWAAVAILLLLLIVKLRSGVFWGEYAMTSAGEAGRSQIAIATVPPSVEHLGLDPPSFSPDGSLMACLLTARVRGELYSAPLVIEARTMRCRPLANVPGAVKGWYGPSWRPDGKQIVFTLIERETGHFGIWLFDIEKNQAQPLARPGKNELLQEPLFSPSGKLVLFCNALKGNLLVCDANGKTMPLPDIGKTTRLGYSWGGDDNTIWASVDSALCRITLSNGSTERMGVAMPPSILVPSPDGRFLACLQEHADRNPPDYGLRLFDTVSRSFSDLHAASTIQLSWSPDGTRLAYNRGMRIWVCDVTRNEHRPATPEMAEVWYPFWHPKDKTLWCVVGGRAIARIADGRLEEMFGLDKTDPTSAPAP